MRLDGFRLSRRLDVQVQPYGFADNAWVWQQKIPGGAQRVSSLGGGVRLNLANRARLDLGAAVPTRRAFGQARRQDARFLMTFTTSLWPWGGR
jgi:hemolysin activation/secretion protein